ncbi:hypothetical protein R3W88_014447 [Solanum pinnatisectum]|uniref:Uncharacterized protein n=1 Tax=Solanum pinnatisectum TaxID=50273 RepID=A0AAV9KRQ9_9SOLN|nr:hypothetical protein R3W88_014447 [Solanum pinnatisectum]
MERERERVKKVELIQKAINQLINHEQLQSKTCHLLDDSFVAVAVAVDEETDHRHQLLSQLLTQLDTLKEESQFDHMNESTNLQDAPVELEAEEEVKEEKVVKELRKIQKQNFITQCLLSVMIVLTLTWQLSEVSIILKMKDGLNHPFRSITSMLTGWIKGPPPVLNGRDRDLNNSAKQLKHQVEAMSLPKLKAPELPHMELASFDFINEED